MTGSAAGLLSTGALARRLGRSTSGIRKLERQGRIPAAIVIEGSGRKVWPGDVVAEIERSLADIGRRRVRPA